ncbi:MAG: HisA/HisF-related TIM barrel protein [Acidimicrobiales bacterium]
MDLYCAIDVRAGAAVRLTQGDFGRQQTYGDPLDLARRFVAGGAPWLHVVDLDAAREGRPVNREVVLSIAGAVDVPVQSGGGVRSADDVEELLAGGVARVVMGTTALERPEVLRAAAERHPGRVALGLDYRVGVDGSAEVAVHGWERGSGRRMAEVVASFAGSPLGAVVATGIDRDGTLEGPDLAGLAAVLGATDLPVIASGGVGSVADLASLASLVVETGLPAAPGGQPGSPSGSPGDGSRRLAGVVVGKALVEGRLDVAEGVRACAPSG